MAGASELFRIASDVLAGRPVEPAAEAAARRLMARLGVGDPAALMAGEEPTNMPAILAAASRMAAVFGLALPDAPGLAFVGGAADPRLLGIAAGDDDVASLAGAASAPGRAFAAAIAEGVEYLSQFRRAGDPVRPARDGGPPAGGDAAAPFWTAMLGLHDPAGLAGIDVTPARRLGEGEPAFLPAALVYREPGGPRVPVLLGNGCSAGETATRATLKALLETIERDAAALWWAGERPARLLSAETLAATGATQSLAAMRRGATARRTLFLDISSEIAMPVVAAILLAPTGAASRAAMRRIRIRRARSAPRSWNSPRWSSASISRASSGPNGARPRCRRPTGCSSAAPRRSPFADLPIEGVGELSTTLATPDDENRLALRGGGLAHGRLQRLCGRSSRAEFGISVARVITVGLQPQPASVAVGRLGRAAETAAFPSLEGSTYSRRPDQSLGVHDGHRRCRPGSAVPGDGPTAGDHAGRTDPAARHARPSGVAHGVGRHRLAE